MKRIKKFVALALTATMMVAPASNVFAKKVAQTGTTVPSVTTSSTNYEIDVPMIKINGKWEIDPAFAYIGIKNIKWDSKIVDLGISHPKKLSVNVSSKYAPYALLLKKTGVIVPYDQPLKTHTPIVVKFWVHSPSGAQAEKYTKHQVKLNFVSRATPFQTFIIGDKNLLAKSYSDFDIENTGKFYKLAKEARRAIRVVLKPYYKNLKLVGIKHNGHKFVIDATSGRSVATRINLKELDRIEIRFTVDRKATNLGTGYLNYLKDGVGVPGNETLTLKIR